MCGICGIADVRNRPDTDMVKRLRDTMTHRGPDDAGIWSSRDGSVVLGHRRLAIIDLSSSGHQPMVTDDGGCAVVFNGEIYNFRSLRTELEKKGRHFKGQSDTEVLLASYREWGERCVDRFNGMFAFAIYDSGSRDKSPCIFFARDRVGKKPFYYSHVNGRFQFASELKGMGAGSELDTEAVNSYLALGYIPAEQCLIKGVKKLPPGHAGRLELGTNELRLWRFWTLKPSEPGSETEQELADLAEELLCDAVALRLASDVPLGVLLSGGMDSSLVAALAARASSRPVQTFTISLPGTAYDERDRANAVARHFGTDHHVLEADHTSLETVNEIAPFIDEPIADSSLLPTFMVSRLTKQHVTVALGGDGGDELFGGYTDYTVALEDERRFGWVPTPAFRVIGNSAGRLPAGVRGRGKLVSLSHGPCEQIIWGTPYFDIELRKRLLGADVLSCFSIDAPELWMRSFYATGSGPIDGLTRTHFGGILPDDFLVKVDRASMAHSLEVRCPFLDCRLVEFAFSRIPGDWKVHGSEGRRLERIIARKLLPAGTDLNRKQGFSIPLDAWLRKEECATVRDRISLLPAIIDRRQVEKLIAGQMKGRANGARLYALLMLAIAMENVGG